MTGTYGRFVEPTTVVDVETQNYLNELVRTLRDFETQLYADSGGLLSNVTRTLNSVKVSGSYTMGVNDYVVLANASASALTISLPDPFDSIEKVFHVKKINTNTNDVTINCVTSGVTIDETSSQTLTGDRKPSAMIYSDGTEYWII